MQAGHLQRQCKTKEIFIFNCSCHNIWNIVFCSLITDSIGFVAVSEIRLQWNNKVKYVCLIKFMFCACYPIWSRSSFSGEVAKVLGIFWRGGGDCIYTEKMWHLYNNTLAFIQQHTGIYTTTHWHLYNKHTGIYTTTHWHLYKSCLSSVFS